MKRLLAIPLFLFFILSNNLFSQTSAGTTLADFSVSLSGAATYNVPISTPPGIKNIAPNLSLTFSSQSGNGIAGWGWNISGLSSISRIASTKFHDGEIDAVDFDNLDRFALDGQRLILETGTYGAANSEYQTENYSNLKIIANGTSPYGANYGPSTFVVLFPDGSRAYYGDSGSSRGKLEWNIWKKEDPQGNYILYEYTESNNLKSIDKVSFGSRTGSSSPIEIKFYYKNRKRNESSLIGASGFVRTKILDRVEVLGNNSLYRKYQLAHYETSLGYERLINIQEYNGANEKLTPINFVYDNSSPNNNVASYSSNISPGFDPDDDLVVSGEFTGDGKMDFFTYDEVSRTQLRVYSNIFSGSSTTTGNTYNVSKFEKAFSSSMLNSGGVLLSKQGITMIQHVSTPSISSNDVKFKSYYYSSSTGLTHEYDKVWQTPVYKTELTCGTKIQRDITKEYIQGDFNGDGLTDVLAFGKPYYINKCVESDCGDGGGGGIPIANPSNNQVIDSTKLKQKIKSRSVRSKTEKNDEIDRAPGGGGSETCCDCNSIYVNYKNVHFIDLNRNLTSGFVNAAGVLEDNIGSTDRLLTGDFNGNGKTNLFHFKDNNVKIYELNSLKQLVKIHHEYNTNIKMNKPILLGDYNGDGKLDFITPKSDNTSTWCFSLSRGDDFANSQHDISIYYRSYHSTTVYNDRIHYTRKYIPFDYNNDGKTDIIRHYTRTTEPFGSQTFWPSVDTIDYFANEFGTTPSVISFTPTNSISEVDNYSTDHKAVPILLDNYDASDNLDYSFLMGNSLRSYSITSDFQEDVTLIEINNNGIKHTIDYYPLSTQGSNSNIYDGSYDELYPYISSNIAPNFRVVQEVQEIGSGITRTQKFQYRSAVTHAQGLGFLGFKIFKKTNWHGTGAQEVWSVSTHNPQKRGAITQQWLSLSPLDVPSGFFSKTDYTYTTNLLGNKVFINALNQEVVQDVLTGTTQTKATTFDPYYNPLTITTTRPNSSTIITNTYFNNPIATNEYYHIGRLNTKIETNTIGGNSFTTEEQYIYNNNLIYDFKKKGNSTPWLTESYSYDPFGNVIKKITSGSGISNRTEFYDYDSSGRFLIKETDIEGLETDRTYNASSGNPLTVTNHYGLSTQFTYDNWQRLISKTDYLGKVTTYSYTQTSTFGTGTLLKTVNYDQGQDKASHYNAFGWLMREGALELNNKWVYKDYEYDVVGRKVKESQPYFGGTSALYWTQHYYDAYSRPISQQLHTGKIINTTYSGQQVTVNDGTKTITTVKDVLGKIVTLTDLGGTVNYTYHGNGVMKSANYDSHTVNVTIDGWGRKASVNDPSAGNYSYDYDILGNIIQDTNPKGFTIYTYDNYGKITLKQVTGDHTNQYIQYNYDAVTKLLTSMTATDYINSKTYTYNYTYDSFKRRKKVEELNNLAQYYQEFTFDPYGRIATETQYAKSLSTGIASMVVTKNIYDNAGILYEKRDNSTNNLLWKINSENARKQALNISYGNDQVKTKQYDTYGYLTNIEDEKPAAGSNPAVRALKLEYTYNTNRSLITSRKNYAFGVWDENFTYDSMDRLTNISGDITHSKSYNSRGLIANNSSIGTYSYNSTLKYRVDEVTLNTSGDNYYQNHELQQVTFNAFKKPVDVYEEGHGRVSFEYSPMLTRSRSYYGGLNTDKTLRTYRKEYSSIISSEIIENITAGTTKIITYVGGDAYSAPIAYIKTNGLTSNIDDYHYLHRDHLASIMAITDSNGDILEERHFGAWGEIDKFLDSGSGTTFDNDSLLDRGFTGHEHFFEVSLVHMNGRMYDAKLGRFLSPDNYVQDPYNTQSFNRYGYVWNNPLSFNDPSGEFLIPALIGALISVTVNGVANLINGQGFFDNAGLAFVTGFIGGAGANMIGNATRALGGATKGVHWALKAGGHAVFGAHLSYIGGGDPQAGLFSGFVSSSLSSNVGKLLDKTNVSKFWKTSAVVGTSGLSGGIGSKLAGGKFWNGVRNGLISGTLNHAVHSGFLGVNLAMAAVSGKFRHLFGPDAVALSINSIVAPFIGPKFEKGVIIVLRGEKGVFGFNGIAGVVGLPTFSGEGSMTDLYYTGDVSNISYHTFLGEYIEFDVGFDVGISVGIHSSRAATSLPGHYVYGFGFNLGYGINPLPPLIGIDANIQYGTTNSSNRRLFDTKN